LRFLAGCAVVAAILAAVVVGIALIVGWQLTRDETPGRAREAFLLGDETRYWCVDLKPDDAGLAALFARFDEINEATRRDLLRGTILSALPFPHRRARLRDIAPLTIELSQSMGSAASDGAIPQHWSARGTFSHGLFRLRLAMRVMRFVIRGKPIASETIDADGIAITAVRGRDAEFAFASVGNRVLIADDASRLGTLLKSTDDRPGSSLPELFALHRDIALSGEDVWAFASKTRLPGLSSPLTLRAAAASFDVNERDDLAFRVIVADGGAPEEGSPLPLTAEDGAAIVAFFLPGVPVAAIEIEGEGTRRPDNGAVEFSGRVAGVSKRFAELLRNASGYRSKRPSATPIPPTPPPP
jgi:hypothetical protein